MMVIEIYFQRALNYVLDEMGSGAQTEIARRIKKQQSYISMLASGQKKGSEKTRRQIAKSLGYSYEKFLLLGKLLTEKKNINLGEFSYPKAVDIKNFFDYMSKASSAVEPARIPVYSTLNLKIIKGLPMGKVIDHVAQVTTRNSKNAFGVLVHEENMLPYILPGMIVIIDPDAPLESGKLCFCSEGNMVFRYQKYDGLVVLRSDSPSDKYPDMEFPEGDAPVLYRITESIRKE
jgi:SOS-response transcriptional repressor LexA